MSLKPRRRVGKIRGEIGVDYVSGTLVERIYHLYFDAIEANREAFARHLFVKAHQRLLTALDYAFELQSPRRLAKIEVLAQEQLEKMKEYFALMPSPLEPAEVSSYRTLVELAATYGEIMRSDPQSGGYTA